MVTQSFCVWVVLFRYVLLKFVLLRFFLLILLFSKLTLLHPEYFIALSSKIDTSCLIVFSSPVYSIPSVTSIVSFFPFVRAIALNGSAVSSIASDNENSSILSFVASSSILDKNTSFSVSEVRRATCFLVLLVHSFSPSIISMTSVFASIMVSGVFISWLASVMNRFCFS